MTEELFATRAYSWLIKNKVIHPAPKCVCGKSLQPSCLIVTDSPANHILKYGKLIYRSRVVIDDNVWRVRYWTGRYEGSAPFNSDPDDPLAPNPVGVFCGPRCPSIEKLRDVLWQRLRQDVWAQMSSLFPGISYSDEEISRRQSWNNWDLQKFFIKQKLISVPEVLFSSFNPCSSTFHYLTELVARKGNKLTHQNVREWVRSADDFIWPHHESRIIETLPKIYRSPVPVTKAFLYMREEKFYPEGVFIDT